MKFVVIYGASGIGKESIARELAHRNDWNVFPQHLAFDVSCAAVGFGNDGFEKYQLKICLEAFRTMINRQIEGVVFTFCYVHPTSNFFMEGLLGLLREYEIEAEFIRISCSLEEHIHRVTSAGRKNTNKIQSKEYLQDYLKRFNFSVPIPGVETFELDTTRLSIDESAIAIEERLKPRSRTT